MIHVEERICVRTNLWHEDQALCDGGTQNDTHGGEDVSCTGVRLVDEVTHRHADETDYRHVVHRQADVSEKTNTDQTYYRHVVHRQADVSERQTIHIREVRQVVHR